MSKFNIGDRVYSPKWDATGTVADWPEEDLSVKELAEIVGLSVYVKHDETSHSMAGEDGLFGGVAEPVSADKIEALYE